MSVVGERFASRTLIKRVRLPAPYRHQQNFIFGGVPEWPKGTDCKSAAYRFDGSNPSSPTTKKTNPNGLVFFVVIGIWRTDSKGGS